MKKQLLTLITLFTVILGYSQTFTDGNFTYSVSSTVNNTIRVLDYNVAGGTVVDIPTSVTYNSTVYTINIIHDSAFANKQLTSVTIPNTVNFIFTSAFLNNQLTTVTIPNSVYSIANYAFANNPLTSVTSLAITPPNIATGTNDTFNPNRGNIALHIPNGTMDLYVTNPNAGADWAGFNPVVEALIVGDTFVADYITYEVTSLTPDTVEAIDYDMTGGTVVDIPEFVSYSVSNYNVTSIGVNAFGQKQLTSITIPNSITNIKDFAFNNNLFTSIIIPENVTSIGSLAFGVNNLSTVVVLGTTPPTITTGGGSDTFANSSRSNINLILTGNTTDEYVTDNGALWTGFRMVFEATSATTLKVTDYDSANGTTVNIPLSITIPSVTVFNVTEIGIGAFFDKGLTSVIIPNSITNIGTSAFNTNNLTSVTIPDSVIVIGAQAFQANDLTSLIIGNSVTNIGFAAFIDNNLADITIPSSVSFIGLLTFAANPLTDVTSLAIVPPTITTGTNDTFEINGNRSGIHLHIPAGTMGAYVTDPGALWTGFNPVTEDAVLNATDFELANDIKVITTSNGIKIIASNSVRLENYTIYSLSGAKVSTGTESEISTSLLANGIYVLKLDFNQGTVVRKVVVN